MAERMQVIICAFDALEANADQVRKSLQLWDQHTDLVRLGNIVLVQKNEVGQITFRETHDLQREVSDFTGVAVGSVAWFVYAIAGSLGAIAGPVAGEYARTTVRSLLGDDGLPDTLLQHVGAALDAGSFALVTLVKPQEQPLVLAELERLGGTVIQQPVPLDAADRLLRQQTSEDA